MGRDVRLESLKDSYQQFQKLQEHSLQQSRRLRRGTKEEEDSKTDAGETKAESETKTIIPETHAKKKQCVVLLFLS